MLRVEDVCETLERLGGVVLSKGSITPDNIIKPLHASFPQFLTERDRAHNGRFRLDASAYHARLALWCLSILNTHGALKRNICKLDDRSVMKEDIDDLQQRLRPRHQ